MQQNDSLVDGYSRPIRRTYRGKGKWEGQVGMVSGKGSGMVSEEAVERAVKRAAEKGSREGQRRRAVNLPLQSPDILPINQRRLRTSRHDVRHLRRRVAHRRRHRSARLPRRANRHVRAEVAGVGVVGCGEDGEDRPAVLPAVRAMYPEVIRAFSVLWQSIFAARTAMSHRMPSRQHSCDRTSTPSRSAASHRAVASGPKVQPFLLQSFRGEWGHLCSW